MKPPIFDQFSELIFNVVQYYLSVKNGLVNMEQPKNLELHDNTENRLTVLENLDRKEIDEFCSNPDNFKDMTAESLKVLGLQNDLLAAIARDYLYFRMGRLNRLATKLEVANGLGHDNGILLQYVLATIDRMTVNDAQT